MKKIFLLLLLLVLIVFPSCENEPVSEININTDSFEVDSELYGLISRIAALTDDPIDCIQFNYSFPLFIFDENMVYLEVIAVTDNEQFSSFLGNLPNNYSISLSYPITGTLSNGELVDINNNEQLKDAIDNCVKDEYQRYCNNTLRDCVWEVKFLDDYPNNYVGATFKINDLAIAEFHLNNSIYFGTWTTFYIGDELHLNVNINNDGLIAESWNFDWLILSLDDESIELAANNSITLLEKDCSISCSSGIYQVCELSTKPGFGEFSLEEYIICSGIPNIHDLVSPLLVIFYETEEDAMNGTNPISNSLYTNTENPQTIYVRIEYIETGEILEFSEITIEAISC